MSLLLKDKSTVLRKWLKKVVRKFLEVLKWLKEKNENLSSKELSNFTEMLRELEEENVGSFYGGCSKVVSIYSCNNNVLLVNIHLDIFVFGAVFVFCVLFQKIQLNMTEFLKYFYLLIA